MAQPPLLAVQGLRRSFFGVEVLHGVDFEVAAGEVLGLVGENGSGKSTSMNILGGVLAPDAGAMTLDGRAYAPRSPKEAAARGIAFVHQELNLFANLSIEENLFIDRLPRRGRLPFIDRAAMRTRAQAAMAEIDLDLPPGTPVGRLSQGERQMVEIARGMAQNARVMILDEPTTSLTAREVERLFALVERLRAGGLALIFISHVLSDVLALCDRVTVLRDGAVVAGGRAAEMTTGGVIAAMVGRSIDTVYPARTFAAPDAVGAPGAMPVLSVRGLGQPGVAHAVDLDVAAGEIVGLAGLMGSGRSELARMIFGLDPFAAGSVAIGGTVLAPPTPASAMAAGAAFLTEDRRGEGLMMDLPIAANLILASHARFAGPLGLIAAARAAEAAQDAGRQVRLSTDRLARTPVRQLSGGNQQKVVIGKWMMRVPRLFILDEPTRGIDVGARQEVYRIVRALVEAGSGVLLISSEIEELIGLCDRIVTIRAGALTGSFARADFDREAIMAAALGEHGAAGAAGSGGQAASAVLGGQAVARGASGRQADASAALREKASVSTVSSEQAASTAPGGQGAASVASEGHAGASAAPDGHAAASAASGEHSVGAAASAGQRAGSAPASGEHAATPASDAAAPRSAPRKGGRP